MEIENVPETENPVDVVLTQLQTYHDNMLAQIDRVETMIDVNGKIIKAVEALYEACENDKKKEIYKEELGTRQDVLFSLRKSLIVMKERLGITAKIKELAKKDLALLKDIDFYFGNTLGFFDEKDMNKLLGDKIK